MLHGDLFRQCIFGVFKTIIIASLLSSPFLSNSRTILSQGYIVRQPHERSDNPELQNVHSSQPSLGNLNSEIAHISFVTDLRHKRDLSENEYHIIKLHRLEANQTIEIHLAKRETITSEDFTIVIKDGDNIEDEGKEGSAATEAACLYDGVISSEMEGKAAFSACGRQPGFSGIIVTNSGNWIIEPQKDAGKGQLGEDGDIFTTSVPTIIPHIISRVDFNSADRSRQSLASDELHVPADELEKAAELAKAEAEANTELNSGLNEDNNNGSNAGRDQSSGSNDDDEQEMEVIVLMPNFEDDRGIKIETRATRRPSSTSTKRRRGNKRASPTSTSTRRSGSTLRTAKAATSASAKAKNVVVEIAVFTDDDFFNQMKIRYPSETNKKIKDYVLTMIHSMDLLYQQESLGTDVHFKLVHLEIQKKKPSKLNSNGGKAKSYLTSFCDYAGNLNTNNNLWDHALMLTGHDLIEEGTTSTAGLAWAGTMCYRYYSCSISEGTQFGSVFIITHEIGHSMGMEHDGLGVSKTCDEDKYLMSPTTGPGKVTWSTCSAQNLKDFLKYGTSELRGRKSSVLPVCMTTSSRESKNIQYTSSTLPGQKYDANKQCALSMGKKYTPVMKKDSPFNNICSMLYCGNGTHAISTHPALDGTECATGKECKGGQCGTSLSQS